MGKGRVFTYNLGDIRKPQDEQQAEVEQDKNEYIWKKFKFECEQVNGDECMTNFYGMDMTRDKLQFFIKKQQSLIEAYVDIKTTDGYVLRLFCLGFTKENDGVELKNTAYAKSSQVRQI